ncbi:phospholipase effector Tle1 domain-containing protein [Arcobacter sp. FWKO B]|uniref:phospholipase effector Tle1 domain-containing protein n=1 Tax=Arcobacter sp. FWKO B TaxID=2593672 RepID=UPI0018A3DB20|nr:DUF2235 domain-containing protein [Arcobacter sp. FWKO B]QOG13212.1 DUF2235 domain-containing protein [Arcobacter sp. FWKO B]
MACKVLHIGVFFDGTGNNKINDTKTNSLSNIAKLSDMYRDDIWTNSQGIEHKSVMIYKEGVGTRKEENSLDLASGGGGAKRINEALDEVEKLLDNHKDTDNPESSDDYIARFINVFGFSRGAAMARDFVNTFYDRNNRLWKFKNVTINFVGIYDTVGSFGRAGDDINYKPIDPSKHSEKSFGIGGMSNNVDTTSKIFHDRQSVEEYIQNMQNQDWKLQKDVEVKRRNNQEYYIVSLYKEKKEYETYNFHLSSESANKIVHIIADNEVRYNFPLTSSIKNPPHEEYSYIGVHSDIGGGYEPTISETHSFTIKRNIMTYEEAYRIMQEEKSKLHDKWFLSIENDTQSPINSYIVTGKYTRTVSNTLANITLHRMYELAKQNNVPFKDEIDKHPIHKDLYKYNNLTKTNPSSALLCEYKEYIKHNFIHHSAVDSANIDTRRDAQDLAEHLVNSNDARYVDEYNKEISPNLARLNPRARVQRAVFGNDGSRAVVALAEV